ncbi:hypothetical protein HPB49_021821 [Dermacentor silvarum]|uniref:Uncharacterized protein n=1 Tax=Dermacentor silvarum TaxID=543639 RepID=A0ACB8CHI3_DERSI|nr:hypothetical protein HPB49_021821 [Dermacentor silvarum]
MSVSYGYRYPAKPDHLPSLNPVEERLISPRLPFMSIRRLTHGSGQYGIKRQVVNVPINVPNTVQCLPRDILDDVAIDVHIKRRLVCKPSYKKGLVKKRNVHEWLKHLEHSPLYKYLKIRVDWSRLANVEDHDAEGVRADMIMLLCMNSGWKTRMDVRNARVDARSARQHLIESLTYTRDALKQMIEPPEWIQELDVLVSVVASLKAFQSSAV